MISSQESLRMIKIIPSEPQQVRCGNCKVLLSYEPIDTKEMTHSYYDGSTDVFRGFYCPNCHLIIRVSG